MSNKIKQKLFLILSVVLIIYTPLLGSLVKWDGNIPGYGDFPAVKSAIPVPGFSWDVFIGLALFEVIFFTIMVFPGLIGFKKPVFKSISKKTAPYPPWFKFGLILFIATLSVFWAKVPLLDDILDPYMFVPVFWGLIIILDGIVYKRKGGKSLIASKPKTLFLLALISSVGWFIFEYLNFFILENWYYADSKVFSVYGNFAWYMLCYTIIFPINFEIYHILETIPGLKDRYSYGPKLQFSKNFLLFILIIGIVLSFLMGMYPHQLFLTVWVSPVFIMAAMLGLMGMWNVITPLKNGDWSKLILVGIAMLLGGLIWECINHGSEKLYNYKPLNPSYWKYSIPYVNYIHLPFSEMPILGYIGYIPYAWICWLQWSLAANLFEFDESINLD